MLLRFYLNSDDIPVQPVDGEIAVWLYGARPLYGHAGCVGSNMMDRASRFKLRPSATAMDLVSIAMAVTAADTFVLREEAANGWARDLEIVLPLVEPRRWAPLAEQLERALAFLSGDQWSFTFVNGGAASPPADVIRRRNSVFDLSRVDCVSLFSGGLDSALGALDLVAGGRRPLLVSHASQGDASYQRAVFGYLPRGCQRVDVNASPQRNSVHDTTTRTRSFQFLAIAALAASMVSEFRARAATDLFMCENGLIALNPPLTPRRIGTLSTRTAHPHYLAALNELLQAAGLLVRIINPHQHLTKGETLAAHSDRPDIRDLCANTVSCGKWKRASQQCGRCVPCLIRRASLHAAQVPDDTDYQYEDLTRVMRWVDDRDDLIAVRRAVGRRAAPGFKSWVLQAGPLPIDPLVRAEYFEVADRGLAELGAFLHSRGLHA